MQYLIKFINTESQVIELYYLADSAEIASSQCIADVANLREIIEVSEV